MRAGHVEKTTWEHPKWGTAHVYWKWALVHEARNEWAYVPVSVEFDLFCPPLEQEKCLDILVDIRLRQLACEMDRVYLATPPATER